MQGIGEQIGTSRKSTFSGGGNDCVEVAAFTGGTGVSDTKAKGAGVTLAFSPAAWADLRALIRA